MRIQNLPPEYTSPELTDEKPGNLQTGSSFDAFLPWRSFSALTEFKELFKKQTVFIEEVGTLYNFLFLYENRLSCLLSFRTVQTVHSF